MSLWLESGSHAARASAAFAAIGLIIVTLGINISANSISAANDLMAFCPKYINIRRGQILAAFIGSWAFVPVSSHNRCCRAEHEANATVVGNSCIRCEVPRFPQRLHHLSWPDDFDSHH